MYVASWSGGKDSTASIILAHEHNEPLDLIVFVEVMFDEEISGELPEHIDFVHQCIDRFSEWGYKTQILHSNKTYMDCFMHIVSRGERKGKLSGFPMMGKCVINRECKMKPINEFNKAHPNAIHYLGIASDEPNRLKRMKPNCISLLDKYNLTEKDAFELCEKYKMISPVYSFANRGGCWFCPNALDRELKHLRSHHKDLWNKLLSLEEVPNTVGCYWRTLTNTSLHDKEEQFTWEDRQITIFDLLKEESFEVNTIK